MTVRARHILSLNGIWDIAPGGESTPPSTWTSRVPVPALVDSALPAYPWQDHRYHWHRLNFIPDAPGEYERVILRMDHAMYGTVVVVNGKNVGGDIACYTSQEYDVSDVLLPGTMNELLIRVGTRETLPPESAVGKDQESKEFIPGIWGDVSLVMSGNPRIALVQVIPLIREAVAEVRITVENSGTNPRQVRIESHVSESPDGVRCAPSSARTTTIPPRGREVVAFRHEITLMKLWSPDTPILYFHDAGVFAGDVPKDERRTRFGMREFRVAGSDFLFNGNRIFLRGGNIALHRFFSDADRGLLPWDMTWVKKMLIDIPRAHHFNFFRNHIGPLYSRWYDMADEHGMLIQNEWPFWTTTGTEGQITKEFTRWLEDNWNHPSIIIWDALNECTDAMVQGTIIPKMKELDPTRPWEGVDFTEEHPYIYSLGPVLNTEKFGFARALDEIEGSSTPSMVNEFLWWWLDKENNPSALTREVVERWLGPRWTKEELVDHQSFLATELVELFRRMRLDAIQPFVYLSNNAGPTAHWFLGDIRDLRPKPVMAALRNVFAPFAVSVELWDRHFAVGEARRMRVFVLNDDPGPRSGVVRYGIRDVTGAWARCSTQDVTVPGSGCLVLPVHITFPVSPGTYSVEAELHERGKTDPHSWSRKVAHVFEPVFDDRPLRDVRCAVLDSRGEIASFLDIAGAQTVNALVGGIAQCDLIVIAEGMMRTKAYRERTEEFGAWVRGGKTLLVLEPEFGNREKETLAVMPGMELTIERRADIDRGGYDSYVFQERPSDPVWQGIAPSFLKMFNGAPGGEMVSQHEVTCTVPWTVLARCGLGLAVVALAVVRMGAGGVVISRIQTRGRLVPEGSPDHLYARRRDPVAQQYLVNLVRSCLPGGKTA
jgi:hypothetical protein